MSKVGENNTVMPSSLKESDSKLLSLFCICPNYRFGWDWAVLSAMTIVYSSFRSGLIALLLLLLFVAGLSALAAVLTLLGATAVAAQGQGSRKPHIIFILADDLVCIP